MTVMGEALDEEEIEYMLGIAKDPDSKDSSNLVDIKRLAKIMIPFDNF